MSTASRRRGSETQTWVADWFRPRGWAFVEPIGAGRSGPDLTGMPGLGPEIKGRRDLKLTVWLRQATKNADGRLPFVIHRPDGFGQGSIADWPVTLRLDDFTDLLRAAGYGQASAEEAS